MTDFAVWLLMWSLVIATVVVASAMFVATVIYGAGQLRVWWRDRDSLRRRERRQLRTFTGSSIAEVHPFDCPSMAQGLRDRDDNWQADEADLRNRKGT